MSGALTNEQIQDKVVNPETKVIYIETRRGYQHSIIFKTKDNEIIIACHTVSGMCYSYEGLVGERWNEKGQWVENINRVEKITILREGNLCL